MTVKLLILVHVRCWKQGASGAAGRANIGLCPVSSSVHSENVNGTSYWKYISARLCAS